MELGTVSFFNIVGIGLGARIVIWIFSFLSVYGFFSSLVYLIKEVSRKNDELVRKIVVHAMAMSFVIVLLLHFVQMLTRLLVFIKTGNDYNFLISSGLYISNLDVEKAHLESFGVDLGVFAICLLISRWRYRTWTLKESLTTWITVNGEERHSKK
ncbi:hypothetical protein [Candidatus Enterococcus ferrettii]|uniref:Uncharacterized protein n=1 Tax=Candidatus Enterococcus ferrettii TaxID=2815324 RepID=A0ABV0EIS4_9ENTE|nr:hypothetical protein [Enterococcus sp. 665A]MBO1342931.1 hypothetical protein [Enterococcus sp. 665A]